MWVRKALSNLEESEISLQRSGASVSGSMTTHLVMVESHGF